MKIAEACFRLTRKFPREEMYGMASQVRRAANSIPANIAEGYGRENRAELFQYLRIAQGSLKELETHLDHFSYWCRPSGHGFSHAGTAVESSGFSR